ncbi:MAG: MarR family transcriptional regulator [Spirochaetia bacterium]|nr:MarR family transcriptional regulator [Spirochaetia bacterium]
MMDDSLKRTLKRAGISCVNFNLKRASRLSARFFDTALRPVGITSVQLSVLIALGFYNQCSMSELAEQTSMERTTLTRNLSLLERDGLVCPVNCNDKRKHLVELTSAGEKILKKAMPIWEEAQNQMLKMLGEEEWAQARRVLGKVSESNLARL